MLSWKRSIDAAIGEDVVWLTLGPKVVRDGGDRNNASPSCASPSAEAGQGLAFKAEVVPNGFCVQRSSMYQRHL